jgi:hypothetical protein
MSVWREPPGEMSVNTLYQSMQSPSRFAGRKRPALTVVY